MSDASAGPRTAILILAGLVLTIVGATAGYLWKASQGPTASADRDRIETVVRDYLMEHPEVLPQAMDRLRQRESEKQVAAADGLERPFPGAVLGNPLGTVTLIQFSDYACGYCRRSLTDIEALVTENPQLKVVIRELPILGPASAEAARWALAAAEQGRYAAFHKALFGKGRPDDRTIAAAAAEAGLDLTRARRVIAQPAIAGELDRNQAYARQLGINGTPSWIAGQTLLNGAVGKDELARALAAGRG